MSLSSRLVEPLIERNVLERKVTWSFMDVEGEDDDDKERRTARSSSGGDESDACGDVDDDASAGGMTVAKVLRTTAVAAVTLGGIAAYAASFVATSALVAGVSTASMAVLAAAGGVCVLTSPLVWVSEWRLNKLPTMRAQVNKLRCEADRLTEEVDILKVESDDLRFLAEDAQETYKRLEKIVTERNLGNVQELLDLVHENRENIDAMKKYLRDDIVQDVVKLVVQSDINNDGVIDSHEAEILATKLAISMEAHGIVFDEVKFHRAVGMSPSLFGVVGIVKRLLPDTKTNKRSTFYDKPQSDSESDEEDDDESDLEDDCFDMFYVSVEDEMKKMNNPEIHRMMDTYEKKTKKRPTLLSISPDYNRNFKGLRCSVKGAEMLGPLCSDDESDS